MTMSMPMPRPSKGLVDAICRTDFASFARMSFHSLRPGIPFRPNWSIDALTYHLEQVRLGKIKRLIINMPPRSLKSMVSSVAFPAFILGHDPTKRLIAVSYASDLTTDHANYFRAIMNAPWYQNLFPGTRISRIKNTESEVTTTRGGYRLATTIDGTLTGRGGDIAIVDDPLKSIDALSDSKRERPNDWFNHTLLSRLDDKQEGAIVVVMQRLHVDDLTGMLLRAPGEWTLLKLPAIAREEERIQIGPDKYHVRHIGDLLHAEREPKTVLDAMLAQIGPDMFAAQYDQEPTPPEGAMIKRPWVRRYDQLPARESSSYVLQSWDTASKEGGQNDYSVCTTWLYHDNKYYLMDVLRDRFNYPTMRARAIAHAGVHRPNIILIEDTGLGTGLEPELRNAGLSAIGVKPVLDKVTRMSIQSAKFASGQVYFPNQASWLADLESELFAFPNGRHDDQVDSISQALAHKMSRFEWSQKKLDGLARLTEGLAFRRRFG
jgi:predicted phage terminase large subunit-like protein